MLRVATCYNATSAILRAGGSRSVFSFRSRKYKCPDGTIRIVRRNPDKAFPLAIKSASASLKGQLTVIQSASAGIGGDYKTNVDSLLIALDEKNNSLMIKYRAAYEVYATNPCGKSDYLADEVRSISDAHSRLVDSGLKIQLFVELIKTQPTNSGLITQVFQELVSGMGPGHPELNSQAAVVAVKAASVDVGTWISRPALGDQGPAQ
jgi:hypothetical protein